MSDFDFNSVLADLPDNPCPRGGTGVSKEVRVKKIAKLFVEHVCTGDPLTYEVLMDAFGDKTTNYISNIVGAGHFNFWRTKRPNGVKLCLDNVRPAMKELTDKEIHGVLEENGVAPDDFKELVQKLPPAI